MPKPIPERAPIAESFSGVVLQAGAAQALAFSPVSNTTVIASGDFVVRYGVRFLGKPHVSIVPGLLALDYGEMMTGEEAWDFLLKRSNLYPRSEVIGYRNDGKDDMVFIRQLDLALTPEALVYADASATTPIAKPTALIASGDAQISPRLLEYLPRYDTIAAWQVGTQP